jgi:hypothetical protein
MSVATRSKILDCFHQAVYPGKLSEKYSGHDPKNFLGRDRNIFLGRDWLLDFWVVTGSGRDLRVDGPQHYLRFFSLKMSLFRQIHHRVLGQDATIHGINVKSAQKINYK